MFKIKEREDFNHPVIQQNKHLYIGVFRVPPRWDERDIPLSAGEKIVIYANLVGFAGFDPSANFDDTSLVLVNTYEPLIYTALPGSAEPFEPGLATRWETSADGLTWDFYLREGVKFHDGTDLTADTVKFSFERTINMGVGASFYWWAVESIEAVDTYQIRINLSVPQPFDVVAIVHSCTPID